MPTQRFLGKPHPALPHAWGRTVGCGNRGLGSQAVENKPLGMDSGEAGSEMRGGWGPTVL